MSQLLHAEVDIIEKGISEFKSENYEEALHIFLEAREKQPESPVAAFYLGLIYKQLGDYNEAVRYLLDAAKLTPPVKDAYNELIEAFYNLGDLQRAKEWIDKAEKEDINPAQTSFLKGLVLFKAGENKKAIDAFKKAKEIDSAMAQAADFQTGLVYGQERKLKEANESFKAAITTDPTSDLAYYAKEYSDTIAATLEKHRNWRFTVGASYQYDDNVVLKPSTEIAAVEITGEKDSSVIGTFRVDYTPLLSGPWLFNAQYYLYSNTYSKTKTYNLLTQNISLMPGYIFGNSAITLPLVYSHTWLHEREYMSVVLVKPTLNILLLPGYTGQFSLGYAKRAAFWPILDPDEDRDADIYSLTLGYVHPFAQDKGLYTMRYEFSREITDGRNWDNTGNKLSAGVLWQLMKKARLTITGEAFLQDYKNTHTIFEVKRRDRTYSGSAIIAWEMTKDMNLNIQYSHTRADSNIYIYDYKRNVYTAGVEYNF